ncbi:ATP-binding cassette domain-containing protein [Microbacterium sp. SY138]|uniref:ATP-binding cassette domain-containing protein n=1 Tax=Microbacterium sp. SY138 TaxID=3149040 RepID=UPI00321AF793
MTTVSAHGIRLSYSGTVVLDNVDLDLHGGVLTALIGPNGAGKSTLFSVLAGDVQPERGRVMLDERPVSSFSPKELARRRSVLPQDHAVRFSYSVTEIVRLARLSYPPDHERDEQIVSSAIETVEMSHMTNRDVQTLSGGEMGRTAFARVLAQTTPSCSWMNRRPLSTCATRKQSSGKRVNCAMKGPASSSSCTTSTSRQRTLTASCSWSRGASWPTARRGTCSPLTPSSGSTGSPYSSPNTPPADVR